MALFKSKEEYKQEPAEATAPAIPSTPMTLTPDQLTQLITAAVKAARQPNEYEQRKIDREIALEQRRNVERLELAKAEEESKATRKRNCPHHNGRTHTWVAQVHQPRGEDAYFIATCQRCLTQLPKIRCSPEQAREGIGLHLYKTLDMAALERMSEQQKQQPVAV